MMYEAKAYVSKRFPFFLYTRGYNGVVHIVDIRNGYSVVSEVFSEFTDADLEAIATPLYTHEAK